MPCLATLVKMGLNGHLRYIRTDFVNAITISKQTGMYAYDAYFLDCAIRLKTPLLTLDRKLMSAAQELNIKVLEV